MHELRVGIDISPLALTRAGTARYIQNLLGGLERQNEIDLHAHRFGGGGKATAFARDTAWYLGVLPLAARRDDVLHCPTFRAPVRSPAPLVVTFHDLAVLRFPGAFNRWSRNYGRVVVPRVARAADRIIAVSDFTRDELVELLGVPEAKIRVIPNGVGDPFVAEGEAATGDYVLAVGTLEPRKNLDRLVEGFRRAGLDGCELRLVGATGWGGIRPAANGNVRWLGEVPDDRLAALYRGARCAAYVSVYEGFGLPVLEAMACGTAVVASDVPPVRALGAGVVRVDPLDPDAIAAGLREALDRRDELARQGRSSAAAYSWDRVAAETVSVYQELAA